MKRSKRFVFRRWNVKRSSNLWNASQPISWRAEHLWNVTQSKATCPAPNLAHCIRQTLPHADSRECAQASAANDSEPQKAYGSRHGCESHHSGSRRRHSNTNLRAKGCRPVNSYWNVAAGTRNGVIHNHGDFRRLFAVRSHSPQTLARTLDCQRVEGFAEYNARD